MKKIPFLALLVCMLLTVSTLFAQSGKIPPFRIMQTNGKIFKAEELPMGKPIILIYFLPDCDHCQNLTREITRRMAEFKKASIAMITYQPINQVSKFVTDYNLNRYPNMFVGTEGNSLFVRNYYRVEQLPFMALYTKDGNMVKTYIKEEALKSLSADLKNLK